MLVLKLQNINRVISADNIGIVDMIIDIVFLFGVVIDSYEILNGEHIDSKSIYIGTDEEGEVSQVINKNRRVLSDSTTRQINITVEKGE